jgi:hypothetical protein
VLWIAVLASLVLLVVAARRAASPAARTGWLAAFAGVVIAVLATRFGTRALYALIPTVTLFASRWLQAKAQRGRDGSPSAPPRTRAPMTREEALRVLGLRAGASRAEIARAHRTLIKKVHPDHGGSHALAQQVNEAKLVLEASMPV